MRTIHKIVNSVLKNLEDNRLLKVTKYEEIGDLYTRMIMDGDAILIAERKQEEESQKQWIEYKKNQESKGLG